MVHATLVFCKIGDTTRILNARPNIQQSWGYVEHRIRLPQSILSSTDTITLEFIMQYGRKDYINIKSISFGAYDDTEDALITASGITLICNYGGYSSPSPGFIPMVSNDVVKITSLPYTGCVLDYAICTGNIYDSTNHVLPSYIPPTKFPLDVYLYSIFESGILSLHFRRF
jgi:hypothetical protein